MLDKSTERILQRMDRMGFAGAGEALREIERLREERAEIYAKYQLERGELLTEIERLRNVIDRAARAWLSLDPPLQWEGDVGDAMVAAVAEIERLQMQLKMQPLPEYRDDPRLYEIIEGQRAEIERLRGLLREALRIDAGDFSVNVDEWMMRVREALGE